MLTGTGGGGCTTSPLVDSSGVALRATSEVKHEPRQAPELTVACALTKGDRPELVVQKLTELGVDTIVLLRAARSVVKWDEARATAATTRLRVISREAGAQCRRARLPVIDGPVAPARAGGARRLGDRRPRRCPRRPAGAPAVGRMGRCDRPGRGLRRPRARRVRGAPRLAVGPFVLRAETAAIAAASALSGRRVASSSVSPSDRGEW